MITKRVRNYPSHHNMTKESITLYVMMEMLKDFGVMTRWYMPIAAGNLNNVHFDLRAGRYHKYEVKRRKTSSN